MNKWQKEVAESLLGSEEAAIKALEGSYKSALRDIGDRIRIFESEIQQLEQAVSTATGEEAAVLKSMHRSKVYQKQYQEALRNQVSAIVDNLQSKEYATIQRYLDDSYTTGYVGAMYDMAGQGIPVITPINQAAAVKAILTDSKISKGLYSALGIDTKKLKRTITAEITRGISTGMMYNDIARNISNLTRAPLSRAKTIARTEGHRIQQAADHDAMKAAKEKGADVVKQWDASLDGDTRKNHRKLDGQIREIDEPFTVGKFKPMFPGDFGDPAEDCNCRCRVLQRAKWALDEDELQTLKDRAEYFGLDKTDDFEDFKKKYLKAEKKQEEGVATSWIKTGDLPPSMFEFTEYQQYREAKEAYSGDLEYVENSAWERLGGYSGYSATEMYSAKRFDATIAQLQAKYPLPKSSRGMVIGDYDRVQMYLTDKQRERIGDGATAQHWVNPDTGKVVIGFKPNLTTTTFDEDLLRRQKRIDIGDVLDEVFYNSAEGAAIHEYGHEMQEYITKGMIFDDPDALEFYDWYKSLGKDEIRHGLSDYAATNMGEFAAECFAELQTGNPRPIAKKYGEYLEKLMKKDYDTTSLTKGVEDSLLKKIDTSSIETVILPKKEYAHIMSEVSTHITERQKQQEIFTKAIGKFIYTFENNGFGEYRIIGKKPIDDELAKWLGE